MLDGQAVRLKRHGGASPFLAADVAEKTERKAFFVRMVYCFPGQRFAHLVILTVIFGLPSYKIFSFGGFTPIIFSVFDFYPYKNFSFGEFGAFCPCENLM